MAAVEAGEAEGLDLKDTLAGYAEGGGKGGTGDLAGGLFEAERLADVEGDEQLAELRGVVGGNGRGDFLRNAVGEFVG